MSSDTQPPVEPPRDPMAVSATSAMLGVEQVQVTADGKVAIPADLALAARRR